MACKNNVEVDQQLNNGLEWLLETIQINYTQLHNRVKMESTIQVFQKTNFFPCIQNHVFVNSIQNECIYGYENLS
jgi:hypothetical protein